MIFSLQKLGVSLMIGGVALIAVGGFGYFKGYSSGKASMEKKVSNLILQHSENLARKEAENAAISANYERRLADALSAREKERARVQRYARALANANADNDRLRIAQAAAGGRDESQDSLPACRERAAALGDLLIQTLRTSEDCAIHAENLAGDVRALRGSWPGGEK